MSLSNKSLPCLLVTGATGRMGKEVISSAQEDFNIIAYKRDEFSKKVKESNIIIDFTLPEFTQTLLKESLKEKKPLVIGTTGHDKKQTSQIESASQEIPILISANFSIGINLLLGLTKQISQKIPQDKFDIEIIETHHKKKKDAPSGTALSILEAIQAGRKNKSKVLYGRKGIGEREAGEIGIHSLRSGDIIGEHSIIFGTEGERIELSHKASSRSIFAKGCVQSAKWLIEKPAGLYSMLDVLGFPSINK